ncbi:MBL fold metallo-hydrolase [Spongiactinospora sp. TRM90649]|uniref:MBL fold metallo-hydrolase n=1 Tax=Spongiactinospora sp. TRM90649 TaxID=3031114 RepID=UPI0023F89E3D|nr:MBL fold metallo-hydrolase [Spongiactinospora sp. TRM90649]MDF5753408.1 MBL fold metallo-hydrolase [Spongiactinospora sp. TRM90649]
MELTKFGHACVRLEKDGKILVIDPGAFSEESALDAADAVLITHEHFDHMEPERLRAAARANPELTIWTCDAVAGQLSEAEVPAKIQAVRHGDAFETAGFRVRAVGELHAVNHPDVPQVQNVGFFVDDAVFYPGDALTPPGADVHTLLVPTGAPWLKLAEMINYLRQVRPEHAYSTHDALYSEVGLKLVDNWLGMEADKQKADLRRLELGDSVTV